MLRLKNFVDFPELEPVIAEIASGRTGLIVVSGMDPRPDASRQLIDRILPSGRNTIFNVLIQEILSAQSDRTGGVIVREENAFRTPRPLKYRVNRYLIDPQKPYQEHVAQALDDGASLIAFDHLDEANLPLAYQLVHQGKLVVAQLDSALWGEQILRYLSDLSGASVLPGQILWMIAVQRIATLCVHCKRADPQASEKIARLQVLYPSLFQPGKPLAKQETLHISHATGCHHCQQTCRLGDTMVLDLYHLIQGGSQRSVISIEECIAYQIAQGYLSIEDLLYFEKDLLRRTNHLLVSREYTLLEAEINLNSRLAELEAFNRVLNRKTEEMFSLYDLSQAMMSSIDIDSLSQRICQKASTLCTADRAVLYFMDRGQPDRQKAKILGIIGWSSETLRQTIDLPGEFGLSKKGEPAVYKKVPPGIQRKPETAAFETMKTGLRMPLLAQDQLVGWMLIQSTQKGHFSPGEIALLQTLSSQAALAIQRASLIDELQKKIFQLEQAQAELVKKERMDREMELARQVQQSLLPQVFPDAGLCRFAATNIPARQMGGDFYDVIQLDPDHIGIVIADVSDKGMPAALYMALSRSLLLAEAHRTVSPLATLLQVNHLLLELGDSAQFVAVFYGVIERSTRTMVYSRAGHECPLIIRNGEIISLRGGKGTILGILDGAETHLSEEQLTLEPGDRLYLYTDGLTDAVNQQNEFFGLERFCKLIKAMRHSPFKGLEKKIIAEITSFQGTAEQFDDMTLLLVEVS